MKVSNKEQFYEGLKRRILTMELEPGADLDETTLSKEYGISRTPLRDVLRLLAGEGYVQIRNNRGAVVSPMSHKSMRDFFMTAPLIYSSIARLAAQNARAKEIAALRDIQEKFRDAVAKGSTEDSIFHNDRFHFLMGRMADNQYLMPSYQRLLIDHARIGQTFWRFRNDELRDRVDKATEHHDAFIDALERGDEEAAVAITLEHWSLSRDHMEMYVRPDPLPLDSAVG